jgi:hypothetical protein
MNIQIKNVNSIQELSHKLHGKVVITKQKNKSMFVTYNDIVYLIRHIHNDVYSVELRDPIWLVIITCCLFPFGIIPGLIFAWIAAALYRSRKKEELNKAIELLNKLSN